MARGARVVVIGGGVIGLSVSYHLAKLGCADVLLLERNQLTSGTSWHAAGIIGPLRATLTLTKLALTATELFGPLEQETGQATGYRRTGGLWLAQDPARMIELRRIADIGAMTGIEVELLPPAQVAALVPGIRVDDLAGALWVTQDGQANPVDVCMAYAKGARAGGVRIEEGVTVADVETHDGAVTAVRTEAGERIACETVVNCAGVWSRALGARSGVAVPVQAVEHMYVVTEPIAGLPDPFPILRDLEAGIYVKEDAGKLVLGGFEPEAKPWDASGSNGAVPFLELPEDWEQFEPFMTAGLNRLPALESAGIQHFMNGPEGFTPDTKQVMGEAPELPGYFVAAGFNSLGIVSSAGAGQAMARWILDGQPPMDLWDLDIARFDRAHAAPAFLDARVREAVGDQLAMHWPFKQKTSGRDARRSPWHEIFAARGAVFGAPTGWERPLWFAGDESERAFRYSHDAQCWWPAAAREAEAVRDRVALFELSPFTKIEVTGPDALVFLQRLCTSDLDVAGGRAVYTQMLNPRGGIEADLTVTRIDETRFRLTSGAATRRKDLTWLRRALDVGEGVVITDITSTEAVLGVMGPAARDLLQPRTSRDLSAAAFPFGTSQIIDLGFAMARATRVSFVGELGWELSIASEFAPQVLQSLLEVGAVPAGHFCLDACRLEKGFRHWGHDIGPEDSPLEAGLGFTVAWDKPGGFQGREALLRQREFGLQRRLMQFAVDDGDPPLLLHDEPVYRDGSLVGRTTSGGRGFRTGLSLCFASLACRPDEGKTAMMNGAYEISVAGRRYPLKALPKPPYDPGGERMRG